MRARPDCPECQGRGILKDPDPQKPVRPCPCTVEKGAAPDALALPARYREADFTAFWRWWKGWEGNQKLQGEVTSQLDAFTRLVEEDPKNALGLPERDRFEKVLAATRKSLQHGTRPLGAEDLMHWATGGRAKFRGGWELWWIHGAAQSGKTTLACAALKAVAERTGRPGRFVSVRTLGQQVKNAYYDSRSWQNTDYMSVRDLVEPLKDVPCLVLDEWDQLDGDSRVAAAFAELLTHRYHEDLPTILTALQSPERLAQSPEHPFVRTPDPTLLSRLRAAEQVMMLPALAYWLPHLRG